MHRFLALLMTCALVVLAAPAAHAAHRHYGETARSVASEINCRHFRRTGGGELNKDAGVCRAGGKRVNVITFRGPGQQAQWNGAAKAAFGPRFFWGNGKGALVVARNGNKAAAKVGVRRLPGVLHHG